MKWQRRIRQIKMYSEAYFELSDLRRKLQIACVTVIDINCLPKYFESRCGLTLGAKRPKLTNRLHNAGSGYPARFGSWRPLTQLP